MSEQPLEITVTEDDLKLVDAANFTHKGLFEFRLDSRRPFGNSSRFKDMCDALGLETVETMSGETVVPAEYKDVLEEQAQKLPYVFEVILQNGRRLGTTSGKPRTTTGNPKKSTTRKHRQKVIVMDVDWRITWSVSAVIVAVALAGVWIDSPVLSGVAAGTAIIWLVVTGPGISKKLRKKTVIRSRRGQLGVLGRCHAAG